MTQSSTAASALGGLGKFTELRQRLIFVILALIVYRIGSYIPVPGIDPAQLQEWAATAGWEKVLNRAGTTFRKLPEADKEGLDEPKALRLMVANPSAIKRPIAEHPGGLLVGFKPDEWEAAFG